MDGKGSQRTGGNGERRASVEQAQSAEKVGQQAQTNNLLLLAAAVELLVERATNILSVANSRVLRIIGGGKSDGRSHGGESGDELETHFEECKEE